MAHRSQPLRVAALGMGAIGTAVAAALASGEVQNARLAGVIVRRPDASGSPAFPIIGLDDALRSSDLVAECAGVPAVRVEGVRVIEAGVDLLVSSVGALVDELFRIRMLTQGPGRCFTTSGAVGGLDVLSAASRGGGLSAAQLVTTKAPAAVVQEWMSGEQRRTLLEAAGPITAFSGNVKDAIDLFPRSLNIAAAIALATDLWDELVVTMVADPNAALTTHAVSASGTSGDYEFTIRNRPHPRNPATSGVVPAAVLNDIERLAR